VPGHDRARQQCCDNRGKPALHLSGLQVFLVILTILELSDGALTAGK
jgi:hypothetical protein